MQEEKNKASKEYENNERQTAKYVTAGAILCVAVGTYISTHIDKLSSDNICEDKINTTSSTTTLDIINTTGTAKAFEALQRPVVALEAMSTLSQ